MSEKYTWTVYPLNEGQEMNFHYEFVGDQEEVLKEMSRVKGGLRALFTLPVHIPKPGYVTCHGAFGCRAEGKWGSADAVLTL